MRDRTMFSAPWIVVVCSTCASMPVFGEVSLGVVSVSGDSECIIAYQQPDHDGAQLFAVLSRDFTASPPVIITPGMYTVGIPFAWYMVSENDVFDASAVTTLTPFASNFGSATPLRVAVNTSFFLASWSGDLYDAEMHRLIIQPSDTYTWARFFVDESGGSLRLSVLDSAMAFNGIIVGTTMAVPEPSTCVMALAGLACGGALYRHRRKQA